MYKDRQNIAQQLLEAINKPLRKLSIYLRVKRHENEILEFKKINPDLFKPVNPEIEKKHVEYWSRLYGKIDLSCIRFHTNLSGIEDHRYTPEYIFHAIIDRILNNFDYSIFESNKNYYERYLDKKLFTKTLLRKDLGQYLDRDYEFVSKKEAEIILEDIKQDFIIKSATGSSAKQGASIKLFKYKNGGYFDKDGKEITLDDLDKIYSGDYVIQEVVKQHEFFAKFHENSLNTLRMITYRSVKDNKMHILRRALKMGIDDSIVDNYAAGGIFNEMDSDGRLNYYSMSKKLEKYYAHPNSKIEFKDLVIPHFQKITDEIKKTALMMPSQRILNFDVTLTPENEVKIIEINIIGGDVWQQQRGPFLGEFTDEIVEYCIKNMKNNNFQHLRI